MRSRQPCRARPPCHGSGFSLVELLAVLAVLTVAAGISIPSMQALTASMRVSSASNELLADLLLARSEAAMRRTRIVVCKSDEGVRCSPSGSWRQGWIVFEDRDGNGIRAPDEPLLQRRPPGDASVHITGNSPVASYVAYVPNGSTRLTGGGFQAGTLTVCRASASPAAARQIVINATGRPRVQRAQLDNCP
jgi:type IV fimbrial biogenesis protein FimT